MSAKQAFIDQLPPVFTVRTFGSYFKCDRKTVYRMIEDGELNCLRRGGKSIRILKHHVIDWMEQGECDSSKSKTETSGTSAGQKADALASCRPGPAIRL